MGISLSDAHYIEIDTYFELMELYQESFKDEKSPKKASQADIDNFLL